MARSYKGYRIGSVEKNILQVFLGVKDIEMPKRRYGNTFSDIFTTASQKHNFSATFRQLRNKGLVLFENKHGVVSVSLTPKGHKVLDVITQGERINSVRKNKWDGIWHIVIYDIPQEKQVARDMLREQLKKFGFRQVQASIWAYPFPCEDIIALVKTYFELGTEVLYLRVASLQGDSKLKKLFKL